MKTLQLIWNKGEWENSESASCLDGPSTLVLLFGNYVSEAFNTLHSLLPDSQFVGCTTSGEISDRAVPDNALIATIIYFEKSQIKRVSASINSCDGDSYKLGQVVAEELMQLPKLRHVFLLSDGMEVNGGYLLEGFQSILPDAVKVTGGLAGDGERFQETTVYAGFESQAGLVVAIGLYGEALNVSYGSRGGWCAFGMERRVTRSEHNVLYELDEDSALSIYRSYLGELAGELPASGLRFPLEITDPQKSTQVVRTLLGINEDDGTITFAGNIPRGVTARLMRANVDSLIDGAQEAAEVCRRYIDDSPDVAILISCVGRKILLKQLADDEVEAVKAELGVNTLLCGFYSYGEIAPFDHQSSSELHNQTMTITAFSED